MEEAALDTVSLPGRRLKFIAEAQVQCQPGAGFQVILRIEAKGIEYPVAKLRHGRRPRSIAVIDSLHEAGDIREGDATIDHFRSLGEHIVMVQQRAQLQSVPVFRIVQVIAQ